MNKFLIVFLFASVALFQNSTASAQKAKSKQPNILWLFQEDLSPWLGCYGYDIQKGHTPTIDGMAARGVKFNRAYVPAPVCSICRSAMMTGMSQIRFGAHEHRSRRGKASKPLPEGVKTIADLMTETGYFCFNVGKTDYNFEHSKVFAPIPKKSSQYPWRERPLGKPFFGQIQLKGGKLNTNKFANKCDRSKVTIPPDYPQNDLYREVVGEHFDSARMDDGIIDKILKRLDEDGLTDSTIVVYFSDHGANNLVRHKQQPTEGGSHVPFIITGPSPWVPAPSERDDLVSMLDLSATTLAWAGVPQPKWMEGQDLFGVKVVPREFVATARDRCDQTIDRIRSIRTDRFRFTRNYMLDRVLMQPQYRDKKDYLINLRESYADGSLDPKLAKIYFGERPYEELYDVIVDPHQMNNLIDDPKFAKEVARHRKLLDGWLAKGDTGEGDEPKIELEMASSKKWGEGVNPEYETIRTDKDGDGLSDKWEELNKRDPADGRLQFEFNCGGWQTEGWQPVGKLTNIAGAQGFLDFDLLEGQGGIKREGLNLPVAKSKQIQARIRCKDKTNVTLLVNGKSTGDFEVPKSDQFMVVSLRQNPIREANINSLQIDFKSSSKTTIEIDWIKYQNN